MDEIGLDENEGRSGIFQGMVGLVCNDIAIEGYMHHQP